MEILKLITALLLIAGVLQGISYLTWSIKELHREKLKKEVKVR